MLQSCLELLVRKGSDSRTDSIRTLSATIDRPCRMKAVQKERSVFVVVVMSLLTLWFLFRSRGVSGSSR